MNIFVDSLLLFLLIMRYHSQLLALTALLLSVTVAPAQTTRADIFNNPSLAAVVYLPYPAPTTPLTPAPEGYKPFYISHVGRHGSRYMVSNEYYHHTIDLLSKAERDKVLTPLGKETLAKLRIAYADAHGKAGMLSTLGGQQHEQIASRMYRNFPEVFTDNSFVDARSTLVNRCMQSMAHFCTQLQLLNKDLDISQRTRKKDQYFLSNNKDSAQAAPTNKEEYTAVLNWAISQKKHPVAIRIPQGGIKSSGVIDNTDYSKLNKYKMVNKGDTVAIIAAGDFFDLGQQVQQKLKEKLNINATLINPVYLSGVDYEMLEGLKKDHKLVITLEDGVLDGGFGEKITRFYGDSDMKVLNYGAKKEFTDRVPQEELYKRYHLTDDLILQDIVELKESMMGKAEEAVTAPKEQVTAPAKTATPARTKKKAKRK